MLKFVQYFKINGDIADLDPMKNHNKQSGNKANYFHRVKKELTNDLFLFRMKTSLKIVLIPFLSYSLVFFMIWFFLKINLVFFEAHGYLGVSELREAYFDYIYSDLFNYFFSFIGFIALLFVLGNYIAGLMIRPFKTLSAYCEKAQLDKKASYSPDLFSDLSLMTKYSEFFFQHLSACRSSGELSTAEVPQHFTKIHKPKFEKTYFAHFCLFLGAICLVSSIGIHMLTVDIRSQIVQLSISSLNQSDSISYFLEQEGELLSIILWVAISLQAFFYTILSLNLYHQVSGPAFGIFSTMRSFTKGNFSARIHLIGYSFLRDYCRVINKYLDHVQRKFNNHGKVSKTHNRAG